MFDKILYSPQTSFISRFKNIALGFVFLIGWIMLVKPFFSYIGPLNTPCNPCLDFFPPVFNLWHIIFYALISAPLWEEVAFRWFPLYLTKNLSKDYKIPVIFLSCIVFGITHGDVMNIWIQGFAGFVFACVYIKNGYHYWSSVILHSAFNYMAIFGFHQLGT